MFTFLYFDEPAIQRFKLMILKMHCPLYGIINRGGLRVPKSISPGKYKFTTLAVKVRLENGHDIFFFFRFPDR